MTQTTRRYVIGAAGVVLLAALLTGMHVAQTKASSATGALPGITTIPVAGGGTIYMGALAGQPTPQVAMGTVLQRVTALCGDRPVLGKLDKNTTGEILAGFFTVTGKNLDGKPMEGLAIVYAPKTGAAYGAVLLDDTDRFPTTVNTMFTRLKQALGAPASSSAAPSSASGSGSPAKSATSASSAIPAPSGPAQALQTYKFPDGTGVIGLPSGWKVTSAQKGQILASGPNGESLRFGWPIAVIDPTSPQARTLMPNSNGPAPAQFVAIPYSADPTTAYKAAITQFAQKARQPTPVIDIANVRNLQGSKNYMLTGDTDFNNGKGKQSLVAQMIDTTAPLMAGTWQMTLDIVYVPPQELAAEAGTITAIFGSYSTDPNRINAIVAGQMKQTTAEVGVINGVVANQIQGADQTAAGMSNLLRNQTVIVDTQTGGHATTSDDLANALINANPNFQSVSPSGYISGIDY